MDDLCPLSDAEKSIIASPAVLHTRVISVHPPSSSNRNSLTRKPLTAVHQGLVNHSGSFIDVDANDAGKVHKASSCRRLSGRRWCEQRCLQVVLGWPGWGHGVALSARPSARTTVFLGRSPQLPAAGHIDEVCSGSLKEKEKVRSGRVGPVVYTVTGCGLHHA